MVRLLRLGQVPRRPLPRMRACAVTAGRIRLPRAGAIHEALSGLRTRCDHFVIVIDVFVHAGSGLCLASRLRREALLVRVEVRDLRRWPVAAGR